MALAKLTVKKLNRETVASVPYLFNTNNLTETVVDGSDAIFYYTKNILNDKNSSDEVKVDETKATIDALMVGYNQPITLTTLKKKTALGVKTFASTITVNQDQIGFGWADPSDSSKSWIEVYPSAFKKVTYQVPLSLDQLSGVANLFTFKFLDSLNDEFTGGDRTGTINYATNAVAISVPNATVVTSLVASFTASSGVVVTVSSAAQTSGVTANNFTSPVAYVVTAPNGTSRTFTVTVTIL